MLIKTSNVMIKHPPPARTLQTKKMRFIIVVNVRVFDLNFQCQVLFVEVWEFGQDT